MEDLIIENMMNIVRDAERLIQGHLYKLFVFY